MKVNKSFVRSGLVTACFLLMQTLLLLNQSISACSCTPEASAPACQLLPQTPVVFRGESVEYVSGKGYRFKVERVYKGFDSTVKEVMVVPGWGSCTTEYPTGYRYLIFANRVSENPLVLSAGTCSGSRHADFGDVDYLENYLRGNTQTRVYGRVLQWVTGIGLPDADESAPLEKATLTLQSSDNRLTTVSAADGSYLFNNIPEGDYTLSASLAPFAPDPLDYRFSLSKGGCREVFVQLKAQSVIEGTMFLPDGKPAVNMRVELVRKNQDGKWYSTYKMWKQTDARGNFSFTDMESGDYLVGHEVWGKYPSDYTPYPVYYFPGVSDISKAQVITVAPQQTVKDLKITLPAPHTKRKITIKVVDASGKPPGSNLLQVSNQVGLIRNLEGKNHNATVVFEGYQEREYIFKARYWVDNLGSGSPVFSKRLLKSDAIRLAPGKDDVEIVLILKHEVLDRDADN